MALAAVRTHMCLKLLRDGKIPLHTEELGTKKVGQNFFAFLPFFFLSCCVAPEGIVIGSIWQSETTKTTVSGQRTQKYLENHIQNEESNPTKLYVNSYAYLPGYAHVDLTLKIILWEKKNGLYPRQVPDKPLGFTHGRQAWKQHYKTLKTEMLIIPEQEPTER